MIGFGQQTGQLTGCDTVYYYEGDWMMPGFWQYTTNSGTFYQGTDSLGNSTYIDIIVTQSTASFDTLSVATSILWNGMNLTSSGDYSVTLTNSVGCDSIVNLNLTVTTTGTSDLANNKRKLFKITDLLGQETPYRKNTPLLYLYDDGTVEKRIVIGLSVIGK